MPIPAVICPWRNGLTACLTRAVPILDLTHLPQTDPTDLYRPRDSIYAADLLITGLVHLDFFSWLQARPSDKAAICRDLQISERPTDVMLTLFTAMELIEHHGDR